MVQPRWKRARRFLRKRQVVVAQAHTGKWSRREPETQPHAYGQLLSDPGETIPGGKTVSSPSGPGRLRAPRKSMRPEHTRTLRTKQTQDGPKAPRTRHDIPEETTPKANTLTQITPVFSQLSLPSNRNKSKHKQMGLDQTYKLWHSKGDHKENKKQPTDRGRYLQMMQPIRD